MMLTPKDKRLVLDAIAIATGTLRHLAATCPACERAADGLCDACDKRLNQIRDLDDLAARLGGEPSRDCGDKHNGYQCTETRGHHGPHIARGTGPGILAAWDQS